MCLGERVEVVLEVLRAKVVFEDLLAGHVVLALQAGAVLSYVDDRAAVAVGDPLDQLAEAESVWPQPGRLGLWTDLLAVLVVEKELEVAAEVFRFGWAWLVLDVVGAVVIPGN